jgi:adenylate cyclase class IV
MAQEKEIKIILKGLSLSEFISRIKSHGFVYKNKSNQLDIYFDTKDWYLYESVAALRLRIVNDKDHSFSFKKNFYLPNRTNKQYIEEIETKSPFIDTITLKKIFSRLNIDYPNIKYKSGKEIIKFLNEHKYFDTQKMSKVRQVFQKEDNEVVVDDIDQIGIVVELECQKDEPLEVVRTFLKDSEWSRGLIGTGVIWLEKVKGLTSHHDHQNKFLIKPDWNVWPNEREMYKAL